jgi:glycosyltransferase involved in cell wall biosynthesis
MPETPVPANGFHFGGRSAERRRTGLQRTQSPGYKETTMIRVLHFADVINRHDFIDVIVRRANPREFLIGACVRSEESNIASPGYRDANIPYWNIHAGSRPMLPAAVMRLAAILRRWRPDILHTHHYEQALIGWMATRIFPHTRLVIGRHYSDAVYLLPGRVRRNGLLRLEGIANRAATRIIAPSRMIFDILVQRQRMGSDNVDIIPYAFDAAKYTRPEDDAIRRVREEFDLQGRLVAGTFARLHWEKGHKYLLQSAVALRQKFPELLFLFVGDGPERPAIERQIRDTGLAGNVRLAGHRRDAMALMAATDFVVQPTLQEAFSQVMAEALWMRKALIITDVSGAGDILRNGENGVLVPKGNSQALAAAIERLATNPEERQKIAANGRSYVEENLTPERIIPFYERSYRDAMKGARGMH